MSMTDNKTFKSECDAWKWIHEMFPDIQWYLDRESSKRAGYNTYRDSEEFYNYVCELGDRVEVNLKRGNVTTNLWIEKEEPKIKSETYKIEFNDAELILVKEALYKLSISFNELDIVESKSTNLDTSINCLELIKRINNMLDEKK